MRLKWWCEETTFRGDPMMVFHCQGRYKYSDGIIGVLGPKGKKMPWNNPHVLAAVCDAFRNFVRVVEYDEENRI